MAQSSNKKEPATLKDEFPKLIESQAILVQNVCAAENKILIGKSHHLLESMWDSTNSLWDLYAEGLTKLDPSPHSLIFGSYFLKYLKSKKQDDLIMKCKVKYKINYSNQWVYTFINFPASLKSFLIIFFLACCNWNFNQGYIAK